MKRIRNFIAALCLLICAACPAQAERFRTPAMTPDCSVLSDSFQSYSRYLGDELGTVLVTFVYRTRGAEWIVAASATWQEWEDEDTKRWVRQRACTAIDHLISRAEAA